MEQAEPPARRSWRTQVPVYSPLSLGALTAACRQALMPAADPARELTSLLTRVYAADGALLTDSGTHALQLAIGTALAAGTGQPLVALPAFTCYDVATAAVGADARILLYDIDPATLAPDPESLEDTFRRGARVVVVSPLYGIPVDWDLVESIAAGYGAIVIEDAAQGHGATWRGARLGSHGRLSVLSLGRGKGWTGGAGGALLWRRGQHGPVESVPPASTRAAAMTLAGAAAQWVFGRPALYGIPSSIPSLGLGETHYRTPSPPMTPPASVAALALATYNAAEREAGTRRLHAAMLHDQIPTGARAIRFPAAGSPGYLRMPLRIAGGRAETTATRLRHLGVVASYPTTLGHLPAVRARLAGSDARHHGAETLVRELISLPTHGRMSPADMLRLISGLRSALA